MTDDKMAAYMATFLRLYVKPSEQTAASVILLKLVELARVDGAMMAINGFDEAVRKDRKA